MARRVVLLPILSVLVICTLLSCGGGGGGGGGSSGTVSGNVSNQTTVMGRGVPRTMIAGLHRWLSLAREADADVVNIHVRIGDLDTDTDENGFFILTGVPTGTVTVFFVAGNATFSMAVDVPEGEVVVLHDVVLVNGMATPANIKIEQEGTELEIDDVDFQATVAAVNCPSSITVVRSDGEMITVDLANDFPCSQLSLHEVIVIKGKPNGAKVMAHKINAGKV